MTFVELNYGDNKQMLFNPNCQTRLLLENIKTRCAFPQEMEVDLSDEYGNLKNISQVSTKYANEILSVDRERLVLIEVKRARRLEQTPDSSESTTVDGESPLEDVTYIPLLNNGSIVTTKFTARLASRDLPPSRSESRSRRPRDKKDKSVRKSYDSNGGSLDRNDGATSSATARKSGQSRNRQSTTPRKGKSKKK